MVVAFVLSDNNINNSFGQNEFSHENIVLNNLICLNFANSIRKYLILL